MQKVRQGWGLVHQALVMEHQIYRVCRLATVVVDPSMRLCSIRKQRILLLGYTPLIPNPNLAFTLPLCVLHWSQSISPMLVKVLPDEHSLWDQSFSYIPVRLLLFLQCLHTVLLSSKYQTVTTLPFNCLQYLSDQFPTLNSHLKHSNWAAHTSFVLGWIKQSSPSGCVGLLMSASPFHLPNGQAEVLLAGSLMVTASRNPFPVAGRGKAELVQDPLEMWCWSHHSINSTGLVGRLGLHS